MSELDALDPTSAEITLSTGFVIELERLKARQFFKLLRIITKGALPQLANSGLFGGDELTEADFTARFIGIALMAIPEAEEETLDFLRSMGQPAGLIGGRKLNKADEERNISLWVRFDEELDNPELDDLVTILEAIVKREAADIQALGKRLASMFKLAQKTGQVPSNLQPPSASKLESSEDSPDSSTSSPRNTTGNTTTSSTLRSRRSGSTSRESVNAATTAAGSVSNG